MNTLFAEMYDAYRMRLQAATIAGKKKPKLLFTLRPEHHVVLRSAEGAFHYFNHASEARTLFGVPFTIHEDQVATWRLWEMVE